MLLQGLTGHWGAGHEFEFDKKKLLSTQLFYKNDIPKNNHFYQKNKTDFHGSKLGFMVFLIVYMAITERH